MPVLVVTRLRLKDPALLDEFFTAAVAVIEQAQQSAGNLGEATFVDWEQASPDLPDWQTSWRHITADGHSATLTQPSPANCTRAFPPPVQASSGG
jgi:hypothetical protein